MEPAAEEAHRAVVHLKEEKKAKSRADKVLKADEELAAQYEPAATMAGMGLLSLNDPFNSTAGQLLPPRPRRLPRGQS